MVNLLWFLHVCDVRQFLAIVVACLMRHQMVVHLWLLWLQCIHLHFSVYICCNHCPFALLGKIVVLPVIVISFLPIFVVSAMSSYHVLCVYQYVNSLECLQTFCIFSSLFQSVHTLRNVLSTNVLLVVHNHTAVVKICIHLVQVLVGIHYQLL